MPTCLSRKLKCAAASAFHGPTAWINCIDGSGWEPAACTESLWVRHPWLSAERNSWRRRTPNSVKQSFRNHSRPIADAESLSSPRFQPRPCGPWPKQYHSGAGCPLQKWGWKRDWTIGWKVNTPCGADDKSWKCRPVRIPRWKSYDAKKRKYPLTVTPVFGRRHLLIIGYLTSGWWTWWMTYMQSTGMACVRTYSAAQNVKVQSESPADLSTYGLL
jgi:hypothetical protein